MNIAIYIYDQCEVLDFSGPFEVFSTASRIGPAGSRFNVFTVGEEGSTVVARGGLSVIPAYGFHNHPRIDVLIVPGGVHTEEIKKPKVLAWTAEIAREAKLVASVCTGVFLLAEARILTNHRVTTHWEDIGDLRTSYPDLSVEESKRWVDQGAVVTSAGISAGIDMCLHLVERLHSLELAVKTARQMEFEWTRHGTSRA